jgi:hypothetical protein
LLALLAFLTIIFLVIGVAAIINLLVPATFSTFLFLKIIEATLINFVFFIIQDFRLKPFLFIILIVFISSAAFSKSFVVDLNKEISLMIVPPLNEK